MTTPSWSEKVKQIWGFLKSAPTVLPSRVAISKNHTDRAQALDTPFDEEKHYFQVRINEMFLTEERQWYKTIDPMVFVVSEFLYDKARTSVPFLVGPMMLEDHLEKIPQGLVFANTKVSGTHPYRGGSLALTVVLCQVTRDDYARNLLSVVELAAGALDFASNLINYTKVAETLMAGVNAMLGLKDTKPVVGWRYAIDPDAGDVLKPGYLALIDKPGFSEDQLWVKDNQLFHGSSMAQAQPFREADFVLFSVAQTDSRGDEEQLSWYDLWQRVLSQAAIDDDNAWKRAKADMASLYQTMVTSPDLTPAHADALVDVYLDEMKKKHAKATKIGTLAPSKAESKLRKAADILEL